jgi:hypothetical protein
MRTLYCSLILPYLNYCNEIWANTYPTRLNKLVILQKKAIRCIENVDRQTASKPLFLNLKLLTFHNIVKLNTCCFMFKVYKSLHPLRILRYFSRITSSTRQHNDFQIKYHRTSLKSFCISIVGVGLWNNLDSTLKNSNSLSIFKCHLKHNLISTQL